MTITRSQYIAAVARMIREEASPRSWPYETTTREAYYTRDVVFGDYASFNLSSVVWC